MALDRTTILEHGRSGMCAVGQALLDEFVETARALRERGLHKEESWGILSDGEWRQRWDEHRHGCDECAEATYETGRLLRSGGGS